MAHEQVQDAMARVTLDVIMGTGFDLTWDAADLDRPCALLEDMHFLMAETFRRAHCPLPDRPLLIWLCLCQGPSFFPLHTRALHREPPPKCTCTKCALRTCCQDIQTSESVHSKQG